MNRVTNRFAVPRRGVSGRDHPGACLRRNSQHSVLRQYTCHIHDRVVAPKENVGTVPGGIAGDKRSA